MILTVIYSILIYLFLTLFFYLQGQFILAKLNVIRMDGFVYPSLSIGIGILFFSCIAIFLVSTGLPNFCIQICLLSILIYCTYRYHLAVKKIPIQIWSLILCCAIYFSLGIIYVNSPDGELGSASAVQTMALSRLEADNFIPYNFSRYIIEKIDPNSIEVVPLWRPSERPPLMAIVNAGISIMLGVRETKPWMESSSAPFGIFQTVGLYLNLLSLLAMGSISIHFFGISRAYSAILLIATNYFYFLNIFFTWPKFFMAFYLMLAIFLSECLEHKRNGKYYMSGVLFGAALLCHEMCLFSILAYFIYRVLYRCDEGFLLRIKQCFKIFLGINIIYLPWFLYKSFYLQRALKGVAYQFFCYMDVSYNVSLASLLDNYLESTSFVDYLNRVGGNILYPFKLPNYLEIFHDPVVFINNTQLVAFGKFLPSVGLLSMLLFTLGILAIKRHVLKNQIFVFPLIGFATLIISSLTSGCSISTVNHVWAYLAFIGYFMVCGVGFDSRSWLLLVIYAFQIGISILASIFYLFYQSGVVGFLHTTMTYRITLLSVLMLFVLFCMSRIFYPPNASS